MEQKKQTRIDKKASTENILKCVSMAFGRPVSLTKFLALLEQEDWEKRIREGSSLLGTKIVYQ